jgi:thioredoxin-like negative regulator of GroEL
MTGQRGRRAPFDFNKRVQLAKIYMEDGALLSAAAHLESLAREMRAAHEANMRALDSTAYLEKG